MKQLDLFHNPPRRANRLRYSGLDVHSKINFKANDCGLHDVYLSMYNYFSKPLIQPILDSLTDYYRWHHSVNSGHENRLDSYLKGKIKQTKLII